MRDLTATVRLGTRGSLLARRQSQWVADALAALRPGVRVEVHTFTTTGDRVMDRPLREAGGKGLFTKELEEALLEGAVDVVVHSFKDVPVTMPVVDVSELVIAAVPEREDPRDVLVMREAKQEMTLGAGARLGTGSLRRRCQVLARWPEVRVEEIRGNVDTRLRKLRDGEYDAIILAMAGLRRSGLYDPESMRTLEVEEMAPAPGQGALAVQCRRGDERARELVAGLNHEASAVCVEAERALVAKLEGDCHSPIAALARLGGGGDSGCWRGLGRGMGVCRYWRRRRTRERAGRWWSGYMNRCGRRGRRGYCGRSARELADGGVVAFSRRCGAGNVDVCMGEIVD